MCSVRHSIQINNDRYAFETSERPKQLHISMCCFGTWLLWQIFSQLIYTFRQPIVISVVNYKGKSFICHLSNRNIILTSALNEKAVALIWISRNSQFNGKSFAWQPTRTRDTETIKPFAIMYTWFIYRLIRTLTWQIVSVTCIQLNLSALS